LEFKNNKSSFYHSTERKTGTSRLYWKMPRSAIHLNSRSDLAIDQNSETVF